MGVEARVFLLSYAILFSFFFYGVGGCKNAMSENLRFIAGLLLLLEWSTEL